jgi:hypothetical protein
MESMKFISEALSELQVRPVERREERRYQEQMAQHHYLGELPKIGETVSYVRARPPEIEIFEATSPLICITTW